MEYIWRITFLEKDIFVVFPTGFDKRNDSKSDNIVSQLSCCCESPGVYMEATSRKSQEHTLENLISS